MALTPDQELELLMLVEAEGEEQPQAPKTLEQQRAEGPINPLGELKKFTSEMEQTGTQMAEKIGEKTANTPLQAAGPYLGAAAGMLPKLLPDAIAASVGTQPAVMGAKKVVGAAVEGGNTLRNIARAMTPGGRASVGSQIGALEAQAGVKPVIPTVQNVAKKMNLPSGNRGFSDIVNTVRTKIANKEPMDPQDLVDFKDLVKQAYGKPGHLVKGTKKEALTAQANKAAEDLLNQLVKGRAKASKDYAQIKKIQNGMKILLKAGAGAAGLGVAGSVLKKLAGM